MSAKGSRLPAAAILAATERVTKAASRDDTRPVLTGVLVRLESDSLTMVATDSYRLAVGAARSTNGPAEPVEALIPARALAEAQRVSRLAGVDEVELVLTETQATLRAGDVRLTTRLIDGQFPDYRQLIPERFEHDLALNRAGIAGGADPHRRPGATQYPGADGVQGRRADGVGRQRPTG